MNSKLNSVKFLLGLLLLVSWGAAGQPPVNDSLAREVREIKLNLGKAHNQYKAGTTMLVTGTLFAAFATSYALLSDEGWGGFEKVGVAVGGVIMAGGVVIMIDSHRYIGKAGTGGAGLALRIGL